MKSYIIILIFLLSILILSTKSKGISTNPVDCAVSDWSDWNSCSKTCGTGTQDRSRTIITQPQYGGSQCLSLSESRDCNTDPCPLPITINYNKYNYAGIPTPVTITSSSGEFEMPSLFGYDTTKITSIVLVPNSYIRLWLNSSSPNYREYSNNSSTDLTIMSDGSNYFEPKQYTIDKLYYITISINGEPYCTLYNNYISGQNKASDIPFYYIFNAGQTILFDFTDSLAFQTCLHNITPVLTLTDTSNGPLTTTSDSLFFSYIDANFIRMSSSGVILNSTNYDMPGGTYYIRYLIKSKTQSNRFIISIKNKSSIDVILYGNFNIYQLYP